jgi:gamma-glutamyltranspeptidase/glutathione hydrolase
MNKSKIFFITGMVSGFGRSGVVVPGTGVTLHDRGIGFVTTAARPTSWPAAGGRCTAALRRS